MFQKLLSLNGHHSLGYPNIVLENLLTQFHRIKTNGLLIRKILILKKISGAFWRGYVQSSGPKTMGELKTGLCLAWTKVSSPPLRPTTPNQLPSLPQPLKNVIKSKGELSGLWNCPWIWKNCKHGLFTCRASTTEQLRMKCFFFFVQKKRSRSFEIPHTIQRESKVCMRLIWLQQLVLPEFCRNP